MAKPTRSTPPSAPHPQARAIGAIRPAAPSVDSVEVLRRDEARYRTLVQALTQIVWTAAASGELVDDQPSWRAFTGQEPEQVTGWGWLDAIHPDDRSRIQQTWRRAVKARSLFHAEFRLARHDGVYRWVTVRGAPVFGDSTADGVRPVTEWIGTVTDVDEFRRAGDERARLLEAERRARSEAERLRDEIADTIESVSEAFIALDHGWRLMRMNAAARRWLGEWGVDASRLTGEVVWGALPALADTRLGRELRRVGTDRIAVQFEEQLSASGRWLDVHLYPTRDGIAAWMIDVTDRYRSAESVRFLSEASRVLASSLDYEATLQAVARLAVPVLADYCIVDLVEGDHVRRVATAHADPRRQPLLDEIRQYPPMLDSEQFVSRVLRSGVAEVATEAERTLDFDTASTTRPKLARIVRELGPKSYLCVPMTTTQGTIGSILCASTSEARRFTADDLPLAEELGRRAGVAVQNARLHDAERAARREAERATERLRAVQDVSDAATQQEGLDRMLGALAERVRSALSADTATVLLLDEAAGDLEVRVSIGVQEQPGARVRIGDGLPGLIAARREPIVVPNFVDFPVRPAIVRSGLVSLVGVPMLAPGRLVGVLHVGTLDRRDFTADDVRFLQLVAERVAHAVERAQILEAEKRARAEAEAANRAKMDFLAMMSHELRTPLNAIAGYAELLELGLRGPVTEPQLTDLRAIRRNEQHLLSLIEEVLSFAKLDAGRIQLDMSDIRVRAAIESAVSIVASELERKALSFTLERCPDDLMVVGDLERMQQVLVNLLSNAIKFTPNGGSIAIAVDVVGERVAIRVRDSGVGIPADQHERIFEPFVQLDMGLTRRSSGTGLGLAISRELARAMRGELTVESEVGAGAEFTFTLPRKQSLTSIAGPLHSA